MATPADQTPVESLFWGIGGLMGSDAAKAIRATPMEGVRGSMLSALHTALSQAHSLASAILDYDRERSETKVPDGPLAW